MIIEHLTVRNFMSVGNNTQAIDFDKRNLTLILGENYDLGGDVSRNGTGKSTIINALSFVLFGETITSIKKDNLINKINNKNMFVSVSIKKNNNTYVIERGRKPNILRLLVDGTELINDKSQGDSRETQKDIEDILGMDSEIFKHIVALNTYTVPILALRPKEQQYIVEQLLGITQLTEKAELLKDKIKESKDLIASETIKLNTVKESNDRIQQNIESLKRKQNLWNNAQKDKCNNISKEIKSLSDINIDTEIENQKLLVTWSTNNKDASVYKSQIAKLTSVITKEKSNLSRLEDELINLSNYKCHACGQDLHTETYTTLTNTKLLEYNTVSNNIKQYELEFEKISEHLNSIGDIGNCPKVEYDSLEDALNHKNTIQNLKNQLEDKKLEINPYDEQIIELNNTALVELDYGYIDELIRIKDHQDFLYKLLTNKDSFIRKRIIDQNLSFLNQQLSFYLSKIGLPHTVIFKNDLTVEISILGQDYDFFNLSRGESNRLILSLTLAFRDVWENLYEPINLLFIDELIDFGLDFSGIESSISILKHLSRDKNKNIFLISHRDDLSSRVNNVLKVIKENGFTTYETDIEITNG
jgi:DNA repair exonuclease SbcCD ATPase subunit